MKGFEYDNKFNVNNAFTGVKFGYNKPLTETDLNEMQEIQNNNIKSINHTISKSGIVELVDKDFVGDAIVYNPNMDRNTFLIAPMKVNINGYEVHVRGNYTLDNVDESTTEEYVAINLGEAPSGNDSNSLYREDLVYLQVWLQEIDSDTNLKKYGKDDGELIPNTLIDPRIGKETQHRMGIRWKISVANDVDFSKWEYGFGYLDKAVGYYNNIQTDVYNVINNTYMLNDINIIGLPPSEQLVAINKIRETDKIFKNACNDMFKSCGFYGDSNLWVAGNPNGDEFVKDSNFVFALPLFRVIRRNKQLYSISNPNGSIDYNYNYKNLRPDNKCYDMIYKDDLIDLRKHVIINDIFLDTMLDDTLKKVFNGTLVTKSNQKMRRLQFGAKPIDINDQNLVFLDSFNKSFISETGQIMTTKINENGDFIVGSGKFNSVNGVIIHHNYNNSDYKVFIIPNNTCSGFIGEYWVEEKVANQFTVKNTGIDISSTFDWILIKNNNVDFMFGTGTFNSAIGTVITHNLNLDDYKVMIIPNESSSGELGEYWIENKTTTSFTVKNTGVEAFSSFDWVIIKQNKKFITGTGTFNSINGSVITHNFGAQNYKVMIIPCEDSKGELGEYWIENINDLDFTVKNTGINNYSKFDWIIIADDSIIDFNKYFVPFVTEYGLFVNGKIKYEYYMDNSILSTSIDPNNGTINMFFSPTWNSFNIDFDQHILSLKDSVSGDDFLTIDKVKDTLVFSRNAMRNEKEIIIMRATQFAFIANRIYHIRVAWKARSVNVESEDYSNNVFQVYINGKLIAETIAYDLISNVNVNRIIIGDTETLPDNGVNEFGFIIDELSIYNRNLSNSQWNLPDDFVNGDALILPSFNGIFRNFRDNQFTQTNFVQYITTVNNTTSIRINCPNEIKLGSVTPKIYCIQTVNSSPKTINVGDEITGDIYSIGYHTFSFNLNKNSVISQFSGEKLIIVYSLLLDRQNFIDDVPNELLKAEVYNYDTNEVKEASFNVENNTDELNSPRKITNLLTTTILNTNIPYTSRRFLFDNLGDTGFDFSTFRNENSKTFAFSRLLDYYVTGNGTNQIIIPAIQYGYDLLYVRSAKLLSNSVANDVNDYTLLKIEDISYEPSINDNTKFNFRITVDKSLFKGDKVQLELALGGLSFDYNDTSKTFVGNTHKAKYLEFVADGENFEYIIPTNVSNTDGISSYGIIESYGTEYNPKYDNNGNEVIDTDYYGDPVCFKQISDTNYKKYNYEYIDGINKPFMHIKIYDTDEFGNIIKMEKGTVIKIPIYLSYQPSSHEILSIWYNYTPYQGIVGDDKKELHRISKWKYFISTLSSSGNSTFDNSNSYNNLINRLPGGSSNSLYITGENIELNDMAIMNNNNKNYIVDKKLIFKDEVYDGNINDDIDTYSFNLETNFSIYKQYGKLQDGIIVFSHNFKKYLQSCINPINKYCGMASIVIDNAGDLYLLILGDVNNNNSSIINSISPVFGDLFTIPYRPNLILRK